MAMEIGLIVGPSTAVLMASGGFGDVAILVVDAAIIAVATVILVVVGKIKGSMTRTPALRRGVFTFYADFYWVNRVHWGDPTNLTIIASGLCILFVGGTLGILIPSFVKTVHVDERLVGVVMSCFSIGAVCGSLVCSRFKVRLEPRYLMIYWLTYGAMFVVMPKIGGIFSLLCIWAVVVGFVGALVDVAIPTIIQLYSRPDRIGSNFSFFSTVANTGEALSGPLVGLLAASLALDTTLVVVGVFVVAVAGVAYALAVRGIHNGEKPVRSTNT